MGLRLPLSQWRQLLSTARFGLVTNAEDCNHRQLGNVLRQIPTGAGSRHTRPWRRKSLPEPDHLIPASVLRQSQHAFSLFWIVSFKQLIRRTDPDLRSSLSGCWSGSFWNRSSERGGSSRAHLNSIEQCCHSG